MVKSFKILISWAILSTLDLFPRPRTFLVFVLSLSLLSAPLACSYKPSYLQKSESTEVSQRWRVVKLDPAQLSPDETVVYDKYGSPQYIRFFRKLSSERQRVYEWVYIDPTAIVSFIDGKQIAYVVVDEDLSSLNDYQKKWLFWGGVTAATVGLLAVIYYYTLGKE
jgi:hypothetical protein